MQAAAAGVVAADADAVFAISEAVSPPPPLHHPHIGEHVLYLLLLNFPYVERNGMLANGRFLSPTSHRLMVTYRATHPSNPSIPFPPR